MPSRSYGNRGGHLRLQIAALAARMMAEDGVQDFGFAKRKAARQLGATERDTLPTNVEVETALREHQALYQDEEHAERLYELRSVAAEVLALLAPFRAYLTGAVLDGTAGRYARIDIDVFADSAKDVEIFFLNQDVRYEHREPRKLPHDTPEAILEFEWDELPVRLTIFEARAERRGGTAERARLEAVEKLLAETTPQI